MPEVAPTKRAVGEGGKVLDMRELDARMVVMATMLKFRDGYEWFTAYRTVESGSEYRILFLEIKKFNPMMCTIHAAFTTTNCVRCASEDIIGPRCEQNGIPSVPR